MASPQQIAEQKEAMSNPLLANTQQLQKLSPNQIPLQQSVIDTALQQLKGGTPNVPFGPIQEQATQNFYQNTVPALKEQLVAGGARTGDSSFLSRLSSAGGALQSNLGAMRSQHEFKNAELQQNNLKTLLSSGLNPTVENLYTQPRETGLKAFLGGVAEAAAPAAGKAAVELGAEGIKGLWNKWWGDKGETTPAKPTTEQVSKFMQSPEAQSLAAQGVDTSKIAAALQRPGQMGLQEALNNLKPTTPGIAEQLKVPVATTAATEATKAVIDKAANYGTPVTEDAAKKVADAGLKTGGMLATGAPIVSTIAKVGAIGLAGAAVVGGAYLLAKELSDDFGKGSENRKEERAKTAEIQKKQREKAETRGQKRAAAQKKARDEAIARGEFKNPTEYEKAQRGEK